ncbi:MAG: membrane protein insertion efficiency factor YidD [Leptospiraceae bacterium]|nr:membrane protein insertion efficiency factor YidD [Leptospiraceae bacterium]
MNLFVRCFICGLFVFALSFFQNLSAQSRLPWSQDAYIAWEKEKPHPQKPNLHLVEIPIIFFQEFLSPQDGAVCRFRPTCSAYARSALRRYGFWKGLLLSADRLVRDNPFAQTEEDPLP